jgi:hypothetical protein
MYQAVLELSSVSVKSDVGEGFGIVGATVDVGPAHSGQTLQGPLRNHEASIPNPFSRWQQSFEELLAYGEKNGHYNVPYSYRDPDSNRAALGMWVCSQRSVQKRGKLLPGRQAQLQALADKGLFLWNFPK